MWVRSLFSIYDIDDLVHLDMPWWCLSAIDAVDTFLASRPQARAFEYGSGASSVWLARRTVGVTSVEHDEPWHRLVADKLAGFPNATLVHVPPDPTPHRDRARYGSQKAGWRNRTFHDYVHAIDTVDGPFDIIVVDGRCRPACLEAALPHLLPDGIVVFDNSGRSRYRQAIKQTLLPHREFRGITACLPYPDSTTLIARDPETLCKAMTKPPNSGTT
jgi:hypothetical protein